MSKKTTAVPKSELLRVLESHDEDAVLRILRREPALARVTLASRDCALQIAAWQGLEKVIEHLLRLGVPIDDGGDRNRTALHYAALYGRPAIIAALLRAGASAALVDDDGFTAMQLAATSREQIAEVVALLAPRSAPDLRALVSVGDLEGVRSLLHTDPTIVLNDPRSSELLSMALYKLRIALREQRKDPERMRAALKEKRAMYDVIRDGGAKIDGEVNGILPPLHVAVQFEDPSIVEELLAAGADVHRVASSLTVWECANTPEMQELLRRHGAG